jgi:hypothetical protein
MLATDLTNIGSSIASTKKMLSTEDPLVRYEILPVVLERFCACDFVEYNSSSLLSINAGRNDAQPPAPYNPNI